MLGADEQGGPQGPQGDTEPFEGVMEPEPGDVEYPAAQPAHVQDGERAASENLRDLVAGDAVPGVYPAPQPVHVRDGVNTVALGEVYEQRHTDYVPAAVHQVLANRFQLERTAKRAAEEELEQARRLIGQGPFVIVKLGSLRLGAGDGEVEVKVGFGGGVTRHMLESVLSIGLQAVRESLPPGARAEQGAEPTCHDLSHNHRSSACLGPDTGSQEDTVRLPGERVPCPACGTVTGPYPEVHQCTQDWPAQKPQELPRAQWGPGMPTRP